MVRLYEELGKHGVTMTTKCNSSWNIVEFKFDKHAINYRYCCTFETIKDPGFEDFLINSLHAFMEYYKEQRAYDTSIDRMWERAIEKSSELAK